MHQHAPNVWPLKKTKSFNRRYVFLFCCALRFCSADATQILDHCFCSADATQILNHSTINSLACRATRIRSVLKIDPVGREFVGNKTTRFRELNDRLVLDKTHEVQIYSHQHLRLKTSNRLISVFDKYCMWEVFICQFLMTRASRDSPHAWFTTHIQRRNVLQGTISRAFISRGRRFFALGWNNGKKRVRLH
jgi:hypothetical protein